MSERLAAIKARRDWWRDHGTSWVPALLALPDLDHLIEVAEAAEAVLPWTFHPALCWVDQHKVNCCDGCPLAHLAALLGQEPEPATHPEERTP